MKMTWTLSLYLIRTYVANLLFLFLALLSIIYLFDTVELVRRANKFDDIPLGLILQMGLLKLPEVGQILFPFAVLFSAMYTFWQLSKRSELVVVRSSGFSVWQFLMPILLVAGVTGVLQMTVINPLGSLFLSKFEQMERRYLTRQDSQIAFFKEGLWLRQSYVESDNNERGYIILHAPRISQPDWVLQKPTAFFFSNDNDYIRRLDAQTGYLEKGRWVFQDVTVRRALNDVESGQSYIIPTDLTLKDVEESFADPETMSFWRLPSHIKTLEGAGFSAARLKVYYHNLLSQPLMLMAMVLLAASVSIRPSRMGSGLILLGSGIFIGFFIFFMSSFLQALGATGEIPVLLAAWSPAFISSLLGISVLMRLEDG